MTPFNTFCRLSKMFWMIFFSMSEKVDADANLVFFIVTFEQPSKFCFIFKDFVWYWRIFYFSVSFAASRMSWTVLDLFRSFSWDIFLWACFYEFSFIIWIGLIHFLWLLEFLIDFSFVMFWQSLLYLRRSPTVLLLIAEIWCYAPLTSFP